MIGRMAIFLTISVAMAPESQARPKRTGASTMPGFVACVQDAVIGRTDGECGLKPESEPCVGLRRALENSQKKTECLKMELGVCRIWGHNGWSETRWISVAAGHLANFGTCVKKQYGNETNPGLKEALADPGLITFLKKLEDGGKVFRLAGSTLLLGALKEERFSTLIENSPFARERSSHDLFVIKEAADTPSPLASAGAGIAEEEAAVAGGSNPATEGENFDEYAKELYSYYDEPARPLTLEAAGSKADEEEAKKSFYQLRYTKAPSPRAPASRSPYSLGLDRSLFERVSSAYRRNSRELSGVEEYLKAYPPAPARDYSDLLKRGGTL
jgi:hypothetical protein